MGVVSGETLSNAQHLGIETRKKYPSFEPPISRLLQLLVDDPRRLVKDSAIYPENRAPKISRTLTPFDLLADKRDCSRIVCYFKTIYYGFHESDLRCWRP